MADIFIPLKKATISLDLSYSYEGDGYALGGDREEIIEANNWSNIGIHAEQLINKDSQLIDVIVKMTISSQQGNIIDFISFDFDVVSKDEFQDTSCATSFYQKTNMHVPYLYYLRSDLPINWHLISGQEFVEGKRIVAKSCNRCGRYLPINIDFALLL